MKFVKVWKTENGIQNFFDELDFEGKSKYINSHGRKILIKRIFNIIEK